MPVDVWRRLFEEAEEDVAVQLDSLHAGAVVARDVLFADAEQTPECLF